jgi:predicted nucleotidyltransferase component of viral defense system
MGLFEQLVAAAVENQQELASLQIVVEKELLHHDIIREMSKAGLLKHLTFIGGTCLRACYGSNRLSEDLDFTGGSNFTKDSLVSLASVLSRQLQVKYDLLVEVSEPIKESGNVDTWKLKAIIHPDQPGIPMQRIHIDICAVPSYDRQPVLLRNHYGVDMGTSGLIIQAQSKKEILADKLVAFALRRNRIKNRDLWDIGWLKQQNISLPIDLVWKKVADRRCAAADFVNLLLKRTDLLLNDPQTQQDFVTEIKRFMPPKVVRDTVASDDFWTYLCSLVQAEVSLIIDSLQRDGSEMKFIM